RDRVLVESATRVAAMSLTAYREGAQGLPAVLEAQRNAREILSQYIDDLAQAWIATATLRLYDLTPTTQCNASLPAFSLPVCSGATIPRMNRVRTRSCR